jgi:curved DNA-binding protein CbpA
LDDGKVKRAFFKASLVVHPDKTHDLPIEHRFLAKRIFDSLSQAKADFDNGTK